MHAHAHHHDHDHSHGHGHHHHHAPASFDAAFAWGMGRTALSAHLVLPQGHPGDRALAAIADGLKARFAVHHVTLQVELGDAEDCPAVDCA